MPQTLDANFWQQRYDSGHTGWDRGGASPALEQWLTAGALPSGSALVPGCGRGYEVERLAAAGYLVTAVDYVPAALDALATRLQARGLTANLVRADVLDWSPTSQFDVIYEQTCLCAIEPRRWPAYTAQLARWLRPGGVLAALFMQTGRDEGPPFHCELNTMRELFDAQTWIWPDTPPLQIPHPNGLFELGVMLKRSEQAVP